MSDPRKTLVLFVLCALTALFGLPGLYDRVYFGHQHLATTQNVTWGLWAAVYAFLSGASGGLYVVAAMGFVLGRHRFRPLLPLCLFSALVALGFAFVFIAADLGHPLRLVSAVFHGNASSVMAWMTYLYATFIAIVLVQLGALLRAEWGRRAARGAGRLHRMLSLGYRWSPEQERRDRRFHQVVGAIGLLSAISLPAGVASLFAVVRAVPHWNSGGLPVTCTLSSIASGSAIVIGLAIFLVRGGEAFRQTILSLARFMACIVAAEALVAGFELFITLKSGAPHEIVVLKQIVFGNYAWMFWGLQIIAGTALPLVIVFGTDLNLKKVAAASGLVLVGVFAFRMLLVIPPQTVPAFPQLAEVPGARFSTNYLPSVSEWSFTALAFGLMGCLFILGYWLLPLVRRRDALQFEVARRSESHRQAA